MTTPDHPGQLDTLTTAAPALYVPPAVVPGTGHGAITHPPPARSWLVDLLTPDPPAAFLGLGEYALIATRRHWLVPARAVAHATVVMSAAGTLGYALAVLFPGALAVQLFVMAVVLGHGGYMAWQILAWRFDQVIITGSRVIRTHGVLRRHVDEIRLDKITDLSYSRTVPGRILGYGSVRIETAGQQQSIDRLDFLPEPDRVYRSLLR